MSEWNIIHEREREGDRERERAPEDAFCQYHLPVSSSCPKQRLLLQHNPLVTSFARRKSPVCTKAHWQALNQLLSKRIFYSKHQQKGGGKIHIMMSTFSAASRCFSLPSSRSSQWFLCFKASVALVMTSPCSFLTSSRTPLESPRLTRLKQRQHHITVITAISQHLVSSTFHCLMQVSSIW